MAKTPKKNTIESVWLKNHKLALKNGWLQIVQSPLSSLTTCLIIAMTLLLTSTMLISLNTFKHVANSLHASNQVTFYLKNNGQEREIKALVDQLKQNELVQDATYTSPEEALKELTNTSEFKEVLVDLHNNPLPPVLLLTFKTQDKQQIHALINAISRQSYVEAIHLNSEWFERLFAILQLGNRVTYLLSFLFGIGILFIVSHAIQEATTKNYQEMILYELMGATTAYIRRPFLYVGGLLGLSSAIVCLIFICLLFIALRQPLEQLLLSYNLPFPTTFQFNTVLKVLAFSTFLGWLGAWISFYKYAKLPHN